MKMSFYMYSNSVHKQYVPMITIGRLRIGIVTPLWKCDRTLVYKRTPEHIHTQDKKSEVGEQWTEQT